MVRPYPEAVQVGRVAGLVTSVGLIIVGGMGLVLGGLLLLAGFLAIDPEDEVSIAMWVIPLLVGGASIGLGVLGAVLSLLPRGHTSTATGRR